MSQYCRRTSKWKCNQVACGDRAYAIRPYKRLGCFMICSHEHMTYALFLAA